MLVFLRLYVIGRRVAQRSAIRAAWLVVGWYFSSQSILDSPFSFVIQPPSTSSRGLADPSETSKSADFFCNQCSSKAFDTLLIHNNKYDQSCLNTEAIGYISTTAALLRSGDYCECDKFLFIIRFSYSLASHHAVHLTMIVCVCRRVSDKEIARHAHAGMSFDEIQFELGVGLQCGCCEGCARDVVEQCSASRPVAALRNEAAVHPVQLATTIMESKAWNSSPLSSVA